MPNIFLPELRQALGGADVVLLPVMLLVVCMLVVRSMACAVQAAAQKDK